MKPVNLYFLSRISDFDLSTFTLSEQVMALKDDNSVIREHEKEDIKKFVDEIYSISNDPN